MKGQIILSIYGEILETCRLVRKRKGLWEGQWVRFEKMPVKLISQRQIKVVSPQVTKGNSTSKRILFRTPLTGYTGYGLHASQIVQDFQKFGYEFDIRVVHMNERFARVAPEVRHCIISEERAADWELLLHPPGFTPRPDRKTVYFTMWESSKLPEHTVTGLNKAELIIVPCQWNATTLSASGVDRPIEVIPLGIKADIFIYKPMRMDGPCIFATGGRLESGGTRKALDIVVDVFKKAFPKEKNVELHVKVFPDCPLQDFDDNRIKIVREYFTEAQLAAWFETSTCFVSCARAEGWGLMQHQALAVGRPLISVNYGGVAEFFRPDAGYVVGHSLTPSTGIYRGYGVWAEPHEGDITKAMRRVYEKRTEAAEKGKYGSESVKHLSWQNSSRILRDLLIKNNFLPEVNDGRK